MKRRPRRLLAVGASIAASTLTGAAAAPAAQSSPTRSSAGEAPGALAPTTLRRTPDGWALAAADETIVYQATGSEARFLCLEHARTMGALRVRTASV